MSDLDRTMASRGRSVFVVTTITFVLASFFVAARLISRFGVLRHRTADDWVMILAWVSGHTMHTKGVMGWSLIGKQFLAFGLSFSIDYGTTKGLGRHDVDIPQSWLRQLRGGEYAFTILY